jgi:hypothetical protein
MIGREKSLSGGTTTLGAFFNVHLVGATSAWRIHATNEIWAKKGRAMTSKNNEDGKADRVSPFITRGTKTGTTHDGRRLHMSTRGKIRAASCGSGHSSAAVAGMATLVVATLAFASTAGAARNAPRWQNPSAIEDASSSSYLAGYQATPTGGLASASVTFTVPTISCTAKDIDNDAEVQTGVYTGGDAYALVDASCASSGPTYTYALGTESGTFNPTGVSAGDVVVTSLFESGTSTWAEIHNLTNGQYWYDNNTANQGDTVVDIGTDSLLFAGFPVPTFAKIKFANATVNGDDLGFDSPTEYNTLNGGDLVIKAGALTTIATGSSFSDTFKHAS